MVLNGPVGPHRRWAWAQVPTEDVQRVRRAFGGSINDVVLAAIAGGFGHLFADRSAVSPSQTVRALVPVSTRRPDEHGRLDNRLSVVFIDLPVGEPSARARLESVRAQMDARKRLLASVEPRALRATVDLLPTGLLAAAASTLLRIEQPWVHAITTNVPGPPVPLYVLGRRMRSLYPYVPIGCGLRVAIGIFTYADTVSFGISADFDGFPDIERLTAGLVRGMDELVAAADRPPTSPPSVRVLHPNGVPTL